VCMFLESTISKCHKTASLIYYRLLVLLHCMIMKYQPSGSASYQIVNSKVLWNKLNQHFYLLNIFYSCLRLFSVDHCLSSIENFVWFCLISTILCLYNYVYCVYNYSYASVVSTFVIHYVRLSHDLLKYNTIQYCRWIHNNYITQ